MNFNDLRILVYSNPLVVDKISKKFVYWRDSGFIFTKNLIKKLPTSFRIYWIVPDKLKDEDKDWFISANKNIELISYPYSTNIHQNRYEFHGSVLRKEFPYTKDIDIVINNQPEVSANLWTWAYNQRRDLPVILSFFHWIDCEKSRQFANALGGYFWRQYDGSLLSDAIYLHGKYAKNLFKNEINYRGISEDGITYKSFFPPPTKFGDDPLDLPDKKIILFNHRLNNTTNWKDVVEILSDLYKERQDFVLWMTDENRNLLNMKDIKKTEFIINKEVQDDSYGYLIRNSHFALCNHKGYSTWNMAVLDAIENGAFVLVPGYDDDVYVSMFKTLGENIGMFHYGHDLKEKIIKILDMPKSDLIERQKRLQKYISPMIQKMDDIVTDMNEFIFKRIENKSEPKKFNLVKNFILERKEATKRDWVNEFWSFHVNSNFQFIRWLLLRDGIRDDTTISETSYYLENQ